MSNDLINIFKESEKITEVATDSEVSWEYCDNYTINSEKKKFVESIKGFLPGSEDIQSYEDAKKRLNSHYKEKKIFYNIEFGNSPVPRQELQKYKPFLDKLNLLDICEDMNLNPNIGVDRARSAARLVDIAYVNELVEKENKIKSKAEDLADSLPLADKVQYLKSHLDKSIHEILQSEEEKQILRRSSKR